MDNGFKKISLNSSTTPRIDSQDLKSTHTKEKPTKKSRKFGLPKIFIILLLVVGLVVIFAVYIGLSVRSLVASAKETARSGKEVASALKAQDLNSASSKLAQTRLKFNETKHRASKLAWTRPLPIIGAYTTDLAHVITASDAGFDALEISLNAILPYADLLGLKGKGTFTGGSANERMQTAITTFAKLTPQLSSLSQKIQTAQKEIDAIDPNRYPQKLGKQEIRNQIVRGKQVLDQLATLFVYAQPLLEDLPKLMGYPKSQKYLVLFKNDKELRPDGGFITAYAIFRFENGKPIVEKADDIYKLDDSRTKKVAAPPEILKYHEKVFYFYLRDSNLSPDFTESVKKFESLYQDVPGKIDYDGIITVDTHVLVEAMKILGSFTVYDRTFNADNDPRCDCPKAIYELEDYSSRPTAYVRSDRKDIIGVLLYQVMQKALGVSPSQYYGRLFQMALREMNQKHILLYLKNNQKSQSSIEALNWGGKIKDFFGDYLHINDANMAGAKSDLFIKRSVKIDYQIERDGTITKTITLDYKNPVPASNCNLEAGKLCLNGKWRNWLRIYVPKGSKLVDFKGSEMDVVVKEDLGKTVFEGFLTLLPEAKSQAIIRYTLPTGLKQGNTLRILIQKQPGSDGNEYQILKNGKLIEKFSLITDKETHLPF